MTMKKDQCQSNCLNTWSLLRSIEKIWSALITIDLYWEVFWINARILIGIDRHWALIGGVLWSAGRQDVFESIFAYCMVSSYASLSVSHAVRLSGLYQNSDWTIIHTLESNFRWEANQTNCSSFLLEISWQFLCITISFITDAP